MNEQVRIGKTFVCECGRDFAFDISTEASIDSISVTVNCPKCGSSHYLNGDSLLKNVARSSSVGSYGSSSNSSAVSSVGMGMFDSPESASTSSSGSSSDSSYSDSKDDSYVPLMDLFE